MRQLLKNLFKQKQNSKEKSKEKFSCVMPWISVQTDISGDVFPCCIIDRKSPMGSVKQSSVRDIWNSPVIKKLRLQILAGEAPEACKACSLRDERGVISYRRQVQNMYSAQLPLMKETKADGWVDPKNIQMLELRPTNTCNFKCRTCEPLQSTSWYPDGKALGIEYSYDIIKTETLENNIKNATQDILPQLKRIHFSGGEALVQEEHYKFLENLIAQNKTNLELVYNTNLSKLSLQNRDAVQLWQKFRKVQLMISLDGWGDAGELIRKGFATELFEKNLQKVLNGGFSAEFKFHITLSVLNSFHVVELLKTLLAKGYLGTGQNQVNDFDFGLVENPEYYDIGILNAGERRDLTEHYQSFIAEVKKSQPAVISQMIEKQLNSVLSYLNGNERPQDRAKFRVASIKVDQLRNEKLVKVLPELLPLMLDTLK